MWKTLFLFHLSAFHLQDYSQQITRLFDFNDDNDGADAQAGSNSNTARVVAGVVVALILAVALAIILAFVIRRQMLKRASARMSAVNATALDASKIRMEKKMHTGYFGERWRGVYDNKQVTIKQVDNNCVADDALEASYASNRHCVWIDVLLT